MRFSLKGLLATPVLVLGLIWVVDYWPKADTLPMGEYRGWYRGLGLAAGPGFLGKRYYGIQYSPTDEEDGESWISLTSTRNGYYPVVGYYRTGKIRENGDCYVSFDENGVPTADVHNVHDGLYISPSGLESTSVLNGTGKQTYWSRNGLRTWELVLRKGVRQHVRLWDKDGGLIVEE